MSQRAKLYMVILTVYWWLCRLSQHARSAGLEALEEAGSSLAASFDPAASAWLALSPAKGVVEIPVDADWQDIQDDALSAQPALAAPPSGICTLAHIAHETCVFLDYYCMSIPLHSCKCLPACNPAGLALILSATLMSGMCSLTHCVCKGLHSLLQDQERQLLGRHRPLTFPASWTSPWRGAC